MRLHALIRENIVVALGQIADDMEYTEIVRSYQTAVDVEDWILRPSVGWLLSGSRLIAPGGAVNMKALIEGKIKYYQSEAGELLRGLYADNTLMGITNAQSDQMFDDYMDVMLRIREGAFPTAIYRLNQKTPQGFVTQEMIDNWKARIMAYLG